jgi:hypothetical protein
LNNCSQAFKTQKGKKKMLKNNNNFVVTSYTSIKTQRPKMVRKTTHFGVECVRLQQPKNLLNS